MASASIAKLLRANARELSNLMAGRIRLDNPAYADRPLEELCANAERLLSAASEFLTRLDWEPMDAFLRDLARQRKDEFRLADLIGALTSAERVLLQYLDEHDTAGAMRSSPQWARLEAGLHRLRSALVECLWEALSTEAGARLESALAKLYTCRNDSDVRGQVSAAIRDIKKARAVLGAASGA